MGFSSVLEMLAINICRWDFDWVWSDWLTHWLLWLREPSKIIFGCSWDFVPTRGGGWPNPNFLEPQPYKTVILLRFCRNMGGGFPVSTKKSPITKNMGIFMRKKNMLKTAYVIQNKHFFLFWNPNFRARLGQNTNINQKLVWLAHFERNHFGFWSLWEVWSCWKKQKYKILFLNVIVFVFI